ncbi:hypothetical protein MJG53_017377 [Ovis ammon polii x Ovis aries]|uniref:Uncharacterized protein n=1 Tax=Ovis ammon polii x Ovis aries TaxID=2918886 RepID=A0ACB9U814_9CETA|nr:hypothetical protein MJG53_017377 [Ovis ammon polii x Ovis aries]
MTLSGFTGPSCEVNPDDCVGHQCQNGGTCQDGLGTYTCLCPEAWTGWDCSEDVDECEVQGPPRCRNGGTCQNSAGDFHCVCVSGWGGAGCEENLDDCVAATCAPGSTCLDRVGSFSCLCPPGRTGLLCHMEDMCLSQPCHEEAQCSTNPLSGSTLCVCQPGYTGPTCHQDLDECQMAQQGPSLCEHGGSCLNTPGSFECLCPPGYTGSRCEADHNECLSQPCHRGGTCLDLLATFQCLCPPDENFKKPVPPAGQELPQMAVSSHTAQLCVHFTVTVAGLEGRLCEVEVNECASAPCLNQADCHDLLNGFRCICPPGFTGPRCEEDINECQSSPCANGGECQDQPGSFHCKCPPGFEGPRCQEEVDECLSGPCPTGASCLDLPGAFLCVCPSGFTGHLCEIPLCAPNLCQPKQKCKDQEDSAHCLCPDGNPGCAPTEDNCTCHHGHCQSPCRNKATCQDSPQGPRCLCPPGYTGGSCQTLMDLCAQKPCPQNSHCLQTGPSFQCLCLQGWTGPLCNLPLSSCQRVALSQGTEVSSLCQNGGVCIDSGPSHFCHCPPGFQGSTCQDQVNPCESRPCQHGATCVAQPNGYLCQCAPGYSGQNCSKEPDACQSQPCHNQGTCTSKPGGFHCACPPGFVGLRCEGDVDECLDRPCHPTGTAACHSLANAFYCQCLPGHTGQWCEVELDPCQSQPCAHGGSCEATAGTPPGFTCHCPQCHPQCDSEECLFDGYDCETPPACTPAYDQYCRDHFHNGHCEKGCNTAECGWDGGDCRPEDRNSEWGPSLALLVVLSPSTLDQQLLALARVLSLTLRVGLWVRKDSEGRDMVYPYPGAQAEEELGGTPDPSQQERAAPQTEPTGKETDSLSTGFVVVMGVDLSRCGPEHPASHCPWDPGLLLRFLAAMAAVGALEPLLPGPLLAAHPRAGTEPSANQLPWPVLCSPVVGVLLLALGALLVLQLIRRKRREHGALWLPPGFTRRPRTQPVSRRRRPPLGEDSIGLKALKAEAEMDEDGVVMCSVPKEGEEAEEMASPPKCQLWSLSSDCQELPQAAMLTPPQDSEMDVPDVDTQGPDGVTPLMSAVCCGGVESRTYQETWLGSPEPWEPLLEGGACPQVHTVGTGETPLHLAARFSRPTAARRLLEAGANPNQPDRAGRTPLHTAVAADAREVCQLLLRSRQTAVDARTEDGTTALMLAARLAVEDLVEELIAAQADVGARDKWGMDLEKLMLCYRETEQMGCEGMEAERPQEEEDGEQHQGPHQDEHGWPPASSSTRPWRSAPPSPPPPGTRPTALGPRSASLLSLQTELLLDLVAEAQSRRLEEQRATFHPPKNPPSLGRALPRPLEDREQLYSTIISHQCQRMEAQRSEPPLPPGGQELLELLLRVQGGGRMEEQRSRPPTHTC